MKVEIPRPFLDRFLGEGRPKSVEQYAVIILRDVEELLNTRLIPHPADGCDLPEYGLPDLSVNGRTNGELSRLAWQVKFCLEEYEPRLKHIEVEPLGPSLAEPDKLAVRVTAVLTGFEKQPALHWEMPLSITAASG